MTDLKWLHRNWESVIERTYIGIFSLFHCDEESKEVINYTTIKDNASKDLYKEVSKRAVEKVFKEYADMREKFRGRFFREGMIDDKERLHDFHRISAMLILAILKTNIFFLKDESRFYYKFDQREELYREDADKGEMRKLEMLFYGKEKIAWLLVERIFQTSHKIQKLTYHYPITQTEMIKKSDKPRTYREYVISCLAAINKDIRTNGKIEYTSYVLTLSLFIFHFDKHLELSKFFKDL